MAGQCMHMRAHGVATLTVQWPCGNPVTWPLYHWIATGPVVLFSSAVPLDFHRIDPAKGPPAAPTCVYGYAIYSAMLRFKFYFKGHRQCSGDLCAKMGTCIPHPHHMDGVNVCTTYVALDMWTRT